MMNRFITVIGGNSSFVIVDVTRREIQDEEEKDRIPERGILTFHESLDHDNL